MRELTAKSDAKGLFYAVGHLLLLVATGSLVFLSFSRSMWWALAVALWVHGIVYSFVPGLVTHELSHGTVFKTRWLNAFFLRFYSLISMVSFHHYKRSHTFHHIYTLFPEGDREAELPVDPTLRFVWLIRILTFDVLLFVRVIWGTLVLAITGKFKGWFKVEWSEAIFPEKEDKDRQKAMAFARWTLLFHASILAIAVVFELWMLPVVVTLGSFVATWWRTLVGMTMHVGLRDNVADFRKCARSVRIDPISRFLYWNMNYHIEHHMYGAIPCYNLPKLSAEIAWDMPEPRTIGSAWREMYQTWRRQQLEPEYQFDTPVPNEQPGAEFSTLAASLGDLGAETLTDNQNNPAEDGPIDLHDSPLFSDHDHKE